LSAGLRTHPDSSQWDYAKATQRALVTCDRDFLIRAASDHDHFGIIYYPKNARSIGEVVEMLETIDGAMQIADLRGMVQFI
jgi:Domain of unknown function (DUF5615)